MTRVLHVPRYAWRVLRNMDLHVFMYSSSLYLKNLLVDNSSAMLWWSLKRAPGYKKKQSVFCARNGDNPELAFIWK